MKGTIERVTVLMPVYNAGPYVQQAIQSIIDQTYVGFRLLIINDGSTDDSEKIISSFKDKRIQSIKHPANTGLIATLNEALGLIQSEYIIRMDADDVSHPERFEKQVRFMDANPEIDISGSWLSVMNSNELITHPVTSSECKVKLLQNTVLGHPSVILRRNSIIKSSLKFDSDAIYAEDYKFWADAAVLNLQIANIPDALVEYRVHPAQVSAANLKKQQETVQDIKLWYARQFFGDIITKKLSVYTDLLNSSVNSFVSFVEAQQLVKLLKIENKAHQYFDEENFENFFVHYLKIASFRIYVLCLDCNIKILWESIFDKEFYTGTTLFQKAKFIFRSIQKTFC